MLRHDFWMLLFNRKISVKSTVAVSETRLGAMRLEARSRRKMISLRFFWLSGFDTLTTESGNDTDHLPARLDRVMERINHSEYGYAGFFDVTKVKEPDLDRMMNYDMQLIQMADNVTNAIQALKDSVDNNRLPEAKGKVGDAMKSADALENAYNGRKQIIVGVQ